MKITDILEQIPDWKGRLSMIKTDSRTSGQIPLKLIDLYYNRKHEILNKPVKISNGKTIDQARLVLDFQYRIVETAIAFLLGGGISVSNSDKEDDEKLKIVREALTAMKYDSRSKECARSLFVETMSAKLFYVNGMNTEAGDTAIKKEDWKIGCMVLSRKHLDEFYAHFDDTGDMDGFLRVYMGTILDGGRRKEQERIELYTAEKIYKGFRSGGDYEVKEEKNMFEKIPVVYYQQPLPEWERVQTLIDQYEKSFSKSVDVNAYFASPAAKIKGALKDMPTKEEAGKVFQLEGKQGSDGKWEYGDVEYLTWDDRPEALKLEFDMLEKYIYSFSQTADISFYSMIEAKLGNISGFALKMLTLDPMLKAENKKEIFTENTLREMSVIQTMLKTIGKLNEPVDLSINFKSIIPNDLKELLTNLSTAVEGKPVMSQKTAIRLNPLVTNVDQEIADVEAENGLEAGTSNL